MIQLSIWCSQGRDNMEISDFSSYWGKLIKTQDGKWIHPDDHEVLSTNAHSFNLDFPPPAFVGDINNANIIILTANGGYDSVVTPQEFTSKDSEAKYIKRLSCPSTSDWAEIAPYYSKVNYSELLFSGRAATVNACAYRSKKISQEPENRKIIKKLPSVAFTRKWLLECVLPSVKLGSHIVVAKRHGLWQMPKAIINSGALIVDPAPVSPHLSKVVWAAIDEYIS